MTNFNYYITVKGFGKEKPMSIHSLFPDQSRVFAQWFSGEVKVASGSADFILSIYHDVNSDYELEWYLIIRNAL